MRVWLLPRGPVRVTVQDWSARLQFRTRDPLLPAGPSHCRVAVHSPSAHVRV
jgi:hypothetical protein